MLGIVLLIAGCYGLAVLLVHAAHWVGSERLERSKHYVLVADQRQMNMEWHLRMMLSFSRWIGRDVRLTVVDRGATEETLAIIERWRRSGKEVQIVPYAETEIKDSKRLHDSRDSANHMLWVLEEKGIVTKADHAVLVDLQNPADLSKMPF